MRIPGLVGKVSDSHPDPFSQMVLADEINRTPLKPRPPYLRLWKKGVTVAGQSRPLDAPLVLATESHRT